MVAKTYTIGLLGIEPFLVEVEVDLSSGLPAFATVGLPDSTVREAKDRIKTAVHNSGYPFPQERITINLAPADIKKEGSAFDLPMAAGILAASGLIPKEGLSTALLAGELSLDGRVKTISGCLPMAVGARRLGWKRFFVPKPNAREAAVVEGIEVYGLEHLCELVQHLNGENSLNPVPRKEGTWSTEDQQDTFNFGDIKGQDHAKRAMEVAAAGSHNILLIGPPGSGKTMLAQRLPSILPPLSFDEAIETSQIYSIAGLLGDQPLLHTRPFRHPHHTISDAGLIGGGHIPKPGEVSLAHHGVLFLDEFPEFRRNILDLLRQPLEDGRVTIARATMTLTYPARFMLVAAMNPCPCGYSGDPFRPCRCGSQQVQRYRSRITGPILDRIDLHVEVPAVPLEKLQARTAGESSVSIRQRVLEARKRQEKRFQTEGIFSNAAMKTSHIDSHCVLNRQSKTLLNDAVKQLHLSARAYHRILKVARTIADLAGRDRIGSEDIFEAIQYRCLDRKIF